MNLRITNHSDRVFVQTTANGSAINLNNLNITPLTNQTRQLVEDELGNINGSLTLRQPEQTVNLATDMEGRNVIVSRHGAPNVIVPMNQNINIDWNYGAGGITNITAY